MRACENGGVQDLGTHLGKLNPHAWAHGIEPTVDGIAAKADVAIANNEGRKHRCAAGRAKPPPAGRSVVHRVADAPPCALLNCVVRQRAHSCFITCEILICFCDAQKEDGILCGVTGVRRIRWILIRADVALEDSFPLLRTERTVVELVVQPSTKRALLPCDVCPFFIVRLRIQRVAADQ